MAVHAPADPGPVRLAPAQVRATTTDARHFGTATTATVARRYAGTATSFAPQRAVRRSALVATLGTTIALRRDGRGRPAICCMVATPF